MKNPKCDLCTHVENVPGDAHSCCKHPYVKNNALVELACIMSVSMTTFLGGSAKEIFAPLNIEADPHGVKSGWFMWPTNFDPIWLKNCDGYEEKENDSKR